MSDDPVLAWHFVDGTLRDGRSVPADGVPLIHDEPLVLCNTGLHASVRLIDALQYAPGATLCRVVCSEKIIHSDDKLVASRRTILWRIDLSEILESFARQCALGVAHLWKMPVEVREYLTTGNPALRTTAYATAFHMSQQASSETTQDASWSATWSACRTMSTGAKSSTAAKGASKASAHAIASAVRVAAEDTVMFSDESTAAKLFFTDKIYDAAYDAARSAQNDRLIKMVTAVAPPGSV